MQGACIRTGNPHTHMHVCTHINMCSDEHASPRSANLETQNTSADGHTAVCPHGKSRDVVGGLRKRLTFVTYSGPRSKKRPISVAAGAQVLETCITILWTPKCLHTPHKHMHVRAHTNMRSDEHASPGSENLHADGHTAVCPHGNRGMLFAACGLRQCLTFVTYSGTRFRKPQSKEAVCKLCGRKGACIRTGNYFLIRTCMCAHIQTCAQTNTHRLVQQILKRKTRLQTDIPLCVRTGNRGCCWRIVQQVNVRDRFTRAIQKTNDFGRGRCSSFGNVYNNIVDVKMIA